MRSSGSAASTSRSLSALESFSDWESLRAIFASSGNSAARRNRLSGLRRLAVSMSTRRASAIELKVGGQDSARIEALCMARNAATGDFASSRRSNSFCTRSPDNSFKPRLLRCGRREGVGVELAFAVPRVEAEQSQDAQIVFANARSRIADKAHAARFQIAEAAEIVEDLTVFARIERVDGEIPARCVFGPFGRKGDGCPASVGRNVTAQRRDLERLAATKPRSPCHAQCPWGPRSVRTASTDRSHRQAEAALRCRRRR